MNPLAALGRIARGVFGALFAFVLFIEEWGWKPLTALAARIARWPPLKALEARIARAPPKLALVLFLVPAVLLFPLKLAALWLIDQGQATLGIAVIVAAKVLGTALVGRLFILLEPQLMQFAWFATALGWWRRTKQRVMAAAHASAAWRAARAMRLAARRWWRDWRHRRATRSAP